MMNCNLVIVGEFMIKEYMPHPNGFHKCVDKQGREHNIDLFVGGSMPVGETNKSIVGRKVLIKDAQVFLILANELELLPVEKE